MADSPPPPFDPAVLRHENGEWQEDDVVDRPDGLGWLDAEISDSFPASDPLSHWAGPAADLDEAGAARGRVVAEVPARGPS